MTDLEAFVCKILSPGGSLDDAGALADFLEEQGDPRGIMLRLVWEKWRELRNVRNSVRRHGAVYFYRHRSEIEAAIDGGLRSYCRWSFESELTHAAQATTNRVGT